VKFCTVVFVDDLLFVVQNCEVNVFKERNITILH